MLVYADRKRTANPRALLRSLLDASSQYKEQPEQHDEQLIRLLIDAGELAQGLIDSEHAHTDEVSPLVLAATELVREIAAALIDEGHALALDRLALPRLALPERVTISVPEGFAFYAVYPEAWARAAARFRGSRTRVIGIRSIGLTLGAVVAAAAAAEQFVSVRPIGHPFDRQLAIGPALAHALLGDNAALTYLVVDEGPGLSGSSLASVARWLAAHGVSHDRIVFMPSHAGGPGPHASDEVRQIWSATCVVAAPAPRVLATFTNADDLSGGAWRREVYGAHRWPPANPQQERRKLLLRHCDRPRLAKFAGLGRYGEEKLALARALADHGWTPQPLELANGFLTREWLPDAVPLDHPQARVDRAQLLAHVADYIRFRAAHLPAHDCPGASVDALFCMLLTNAEQALGPAARAQLERWAPRLRELGSGLTPCKTDNRMHRWEWLTTPAGTILKCDALDHHATHDLIGAQDPLWDLVGARHELALRDDEFAMLVRQLGRRFSAAQIDFFSAAYLAFQCGAASLAATTAPEHDAIRLQREAQRYARALTKIVPNAR